MAAILAFCIVALFSVWIWELKTEIDGLQRRAGECGAEEDAGVAERRARRHAQPQVEHRTPMHRSSEGVPVWTITS